MVFKTFPRGGKKAEIKTKRTLFTKFAKKKFKKPKTKDKTLNEEDSVVLNVPQKLRYSYLLKNIIILGRIFKVTKYYAIVSFPDRIKGRLELTDISKSYIQLLQNMEKEDDSSNELKLLPQIYKKGDYVVCYIKDVDSDNKKASLSLQPYLINQNLNPTALTKGSKLISSISSIEEHGYVLETGLLNFRAFLSSKDIENEDKFYPGEQIVCTIKHIKAEGNTYTAKVKVVSKYSCNIDKNIVALDRLIPGIQYSLTIQKVVKKGLQVCYGEKYIGYIDQFHLKNSLSSFQEGQEVIGTLLFIAPITKLAHFSLLSKKQEENKLEIGAIVKKAKVLFYNSTGIFVRLKKNVRGFIPSKYKGKVVLNKFETVADYIYDCTVRTYDLIAKLYICTIDTKLIDEQDINQIEK